VRLMATVSASSTLSKEPTRGAAWAGVAGRGVGGACGGVGTARGEGHGGGEVEVDLRGRVGGGVADLGRGVGEAREVRRDCGRRGMGLGLGLGLDAVLYTKETR
jgi:hypothetical protein